MRTTGNTFIILLIYVDDVILANNNIDQLEFLKINLNNKF